MRLKAVGVIINVFVFLVACNLFYLQIVQGDAYYELSINNTIRVVPVEAPRGRIMDRRGVVLADNRHSFDVTVLPQDMEDKDEVFDFLSRVLRIEKKRLFQQFWQRKIAPFSPVVVAEDITKEQAIAIEENRFRFPGVSVGESYSRVYPYHEIGSHVLGYVGKISPQELEDSKDGSLSAFSTTGKSGIEQVYDSFLRGREGGLQMEINSRGRQVRLMGMRDAQIGQDISLTIDLRAQKIAYDALEGRVGTVIMMNIETGEILALVSSPAFDPNIFVDSQMKGRISQIFNDKQSPMMNRSVKGEYPPGSVFKLVVAAAGLSLNKLDPASTYHCAGYYNLGGRKFHCMHVHGPQNLAQGIMHSCNVYFFNVGRNVGPEEITHFARLLGLGRPTGIDLPFERTGTIPNPTAIPWVGGETLNLSIGQGKVLVTPMQILRMIATLALHGREVQPYLLKSVNHQELVKLSTSRQVHLRPQVYEILNNDLRMVVDEAGGTAHLLDIPDMKVAGKTGTAQSGAGKDSHAWFAGYTLDTQPRVAVCVFLEYGGSSANAVLISQKILSQMHAEDIL